MRIVNKFALGLAFALSVSASAFASVTQATAPVNYDHYWYQGWADDVLSEVTLMPHTSSISSLTGSAVVYDQGWGGYAPCCNATNLELFAGSALLWSDHFAGGNRVGLDDPAQTYSISASALTNLNSVLASINWNDTPAVTMQLHADAWAYPGWELHVRDTQFSVSSEHVPEPASIALIGLGLAGFVAARKKAAKK